MTSRGPNILFIVWDACRYDYALEHASNLSELADNNLWFEKAIAPAPWSPPSHASIFTGQYPHEHGMTQLGQSLDSVTLTEELSNSGYTCYGVSANGFACQRTGFHAGFDEFYYSRGREQYPEGLNVSGYALSRIHQGDNRFLTGIKTGKRALQHEHKFKSLANIGAVGLGSMSVRWKPLQRIPHRLFVSDSAYNYSPETNTQRLTEIIKRESQTEDPFFAFANYMDTHRPYIPPIDLQKKHVGQELSLKEIKRLNDNVAEPWEFIAADQRGEIDDKDIKTIRELYAGEVEKVDRHLGYLLDTLHEAGEFEDTLIVITSDHGENLGETDSMGRRRMGHESSISDTLAHVPLVIAHPDIESDEITHPYSLTELYNIFINSANLVEESKIRDASGKMVFCQYPATGGNRLYDNHSTVSSEVLSNRVDEHSVAGYDGNWRVIVETTGNRWAFRGNEKKSFDEAPTQIRENCQEILEKLKPNQVRREINDTQETQLKSLGYL